MLGPGTKTENFLISRIFLFFAIVFRRTIFKDKTKITLRRFRIAVSIGRGSMLTALPQHVDGYRLDEPNQCGRHDKRHCGSATTELLKS